ncbi:hypothetical protein ACJIZ3_002698 [Penstemon smallii]|uniref:Uncharacterized protein n=1 Tax=Penstemon smallii TaxID=265156 RepID=A0ABD3U8I4_9LAMI
MSLHQQKIYSSLQVYILCHLLKYWTNDRHFANLVVVLIEHFGRYLLWRNRISSSVPVDLGASIITGVEADVATEKRPDPSSLICAQLGLNLTVLNSDCPLYDTVTNQKVPADLDEALETEFNSLLDEMILFVDEKGDRAEKMSLEEGLEYALRKRHLSRTGVDDIGYVHVTSLETPVAANRLDIDYVVSNAQDSKVQGLSSLERRVLDWHFAHLEYGCVALLKEVSLPSWNQNVVYGGFGRAHCMVKRGYSAVVESLGEEICTHLDHIVTDITYCPEDCGMNNDVHSKVKVSTSNCEVFSGDAVLVTVPLGLGFGVINKVVLEFPEVFWDEAVDYFGATAEDTYQLGAPVLIALVVGKAVVDNQNISFSEHVSHALLILRKLFGEDKVSDLVASVVTDWRKGSLQLWPVGNCIFFAGEATCKEHPDTVGGAMMSGLRETVRIIDILKTGTNHTAEVEAMEAAKRHSNVEWSEVRDIIKRCDAVEFSSAVYTNFLDGSQISTWGSMLKDMFFNTKTTTGRLHLAKELLNLPVKFLKTFASTREGLSTLNSWILDSMGKDGTQLLRHCVRLLVLVSNDLLVVRLSGVGKTVIEKVCVHTSRDIRAIANQLVNVWVELFRKEKTAKGGLKLSRHPTAPDSKNKSSLGYGKPPIFAGHQLPSCSSTKKVIDQPLTLETRIDPKSDVLLSNSHGSTGCKNFMEDIHETLMSEAEKAAFDAAEAARVAADEYAAMHNTSLQLPKILSFQKFSMREQSAHMDESDSRKNWSAAAIGRQDCLSEIDSRNCRVRDWSVDFSAAGVNLENSKMSVDNHSERNHKSNEAASQLDFKEHSAENRVMDNNILTKAWVDRAGSTGLKDYSAIERWQCQAAAASSGFSHGTMHLTDEEDSNMSKKFHKQKHDAPANESSASRATIKIESKRSQARGAESIKKSVVDYVDSLLMPLYKARKIDKDDYKSIMKKTATKVMEKANDAENGMTVFEFLDFKCKNKIRDFVGMLIERHMAMKPDARSGSSEK